MYVLLKKRDSMVCIVKMEMEKSLCLSRIFGVIGETLSAISMLFLQTFSSVSLSNSIVCVNTHTHYLDPLFRLHFSLLSLCIVNSLHCTTLCRARYPHYVRDYIKNILIQQKSPTLFCWIFWFYTIRNFSMG